MTTPRNSLSASICFLSTLLITSPIYGETNQHTKETSTLQQLQQQLDATRASLQQIRDELDNKTSDSTSNIEWEGYAVINYRQYDFFKNVQDNTADRRSLVDFERLILESKFKINQQMKFETELEIEHGGTGSTVEYEASEFGEYELELEKGGEIVVEKAQLEINQSKVLNWHIGHIVVPFGMVNRYTKPTDYFTTTRSLAETSLIPNTWHETGVELYGKLGAFSYRTLIVNGLDSSGFSSEHWVASGYQTRMEFASADDLALVAVLDYPLATNGHIGAAIYSGDSANNRHQQNLNVSAMVNIWEVHARYQTDTLIIRSQLMAGTVENSDLITDANKNLVNQGIRGISATPIGHAAEAFFIEAGYNLMSLFNTAGSRLDLFLRHETFDTMAAVEGSIQDNPRFQRQTNTFGLNYKPMPNLVFKAELGNHQHEGAVANHFSHFAMGLGVTF